jgi:Putative peptidoglycan binding domain
MNRFAFSAFLVAAAGTGILSNAAGQMMNATVQTTTSRVVDSRTAPTTAAKPVSGAQLAPQIAPRLSGVNPQRFNPNLPRMVAQPLFNLQRSYLPPMQASNPAFAALNAHRNGPMQQQQPITVDPATRQTELRTLAAMRQRRGFVTREGNVLDPATLQNEMHTLAAMRQHRGPGPGQQANIPDAATRDTELRTLETIRERRTFGTNNQTLGTIDQQRHIKNRDPEGGPQGEKPDGPKDGNGKKWHKKDHVSFDDALRHHWHEWHDRNWWHDHCQTIVFVNTGYYFLDGSYWYPAYGYDPLQTYYDYDGPVYTYSNLLPDEVIANVQTALQDAGYYYGPITGSLSVDTRAAIANFQRDYGLTISGAIDEPTVGALGLDQTDDYYQTDQGY